MSYRDEDLGEFNDSTVFFQPVHFNPKAVPTLTKHHNPESINLGIYDSIKLSSLLDSRGGELIELVSLDKHSNNTFVSNDALSLLERYSTDEVAFVVVVGNQGAGKSFFCDKILNLSEVRGNHFCRRSNKGINIWSTPFQKDDLKIFLLEISNCDINSHEFKILSTYALMIGSAFVTIDSLKPSSKSAIEQLDEVISDVVEKITPSQIERGVQPQTNSEIFLPKLFYHLHRPSGYSAAGNLKMISFYANEVLPDALEKSYSGSSKDLIHLPFLDTKCIKQEYIRRTAAIFRDLYSKLSEKRYKQLVLNGNIIAKVIKYIESYLNSRNSLNIDELYLRVIEDLYQSAYNYCILSYHEDMQRQFEDERPKPFDQLLQVFEKISDNTLEKFQEFNLDEKLFHLYYERLERHIDEKQQMIMQINGKKTEQVLLQSFDEDQIGNIDYYRSLVQRIEQRHGQLDHRKADIMSKINSKFYIKSKNNNSVEFQVMREIEALKANVAQKSKELQEITRINESKALERSKANKEQQGYLSALHAVQSKIKQINGQIAQTVASGNLDPSAQKEQERALTAAVAANQNKIKELKAKEGKDQRVTNIENKLEDITKKIFMQQKLLKELKESSNLTESVSKDKKGQGSSKVVK